MLNTNLKVWAPAVMSLLLFVSCKKEVDEVALVDSPATDTTTNLGSNKLLDSALAASRDIYLWYDQVPQTFNAQNFEDPDALMTSIRQFSTEQGFADPVDRWSFAALQKDWDDVSAGIAGDFGLDVFFRQAADLRVKIVEPASPAGAAGIKRGWQITAINGNSNITTDNVDFIIDAIYNSAKTTLTFNKPDGSEAAITLNSATYQENPIILDSVYNINGKKTGYLAFNSFLGNQAQINTAFDKIFADFASQPITDMIVDLRYNGGGYVSIQEKLANYLAPASANGNLMMLQAYNNKYAAENEAVNFKKLGSLNLSRIYFIVSRNTASASELLINNLKPHMDVVLVGPSKTYGKPVGFFPIPVGNWYIFPVSFRSTNKNGEGSYFDGLPLNKQVADGLDKDWGDLQEACLAAVMGSIASNALPGRANRSSKPMEAADVMLGNSKLTKQDFKGTIDTRHTP